MTRIRVLQVLHKPQIRGGEIFVIQLSGELRRLGHEVVSVFLYGQEIDQRLAAGAPVRLLRGEEDQVFETTLGVNPALLKRFCDVVDEYAPDIVQVNGGRTVKYGAFARQLRRTAPWALIYRNIGNTTDWIVGTRRRLLYQWIMRRVDGLAAIGEGSRRDLLSLVASSPPAAVIPTGIDAGALRDSGRLSGDLCPDDPGCGPILLFVGSLSEEKRPDRNLEVYEKLRTSHPSARLWFVGDGPLRPELEARARTRGIASGVRFFGVRDDVGRFLTRADILLLLSDTEGVPAVLLEAGLFGLPVVASRVGGIPECVSDGETGILLPPGDVEGAAEACRRLLTDRALHQRMGLAARRRVEGEFTLDRIALRFVEFYGEVLHAQSRTRGERGGGVEVVEAVS